MLRKYEKEQLIHLLLQDYKDRSVTETLCTIGKIAPREHIQIESP